MIRHAMPLALALSAVLTVLPPPAAALDVDEIGSFHVGGRQVSLSGMPKREVVFTQRGERVARRSRTPRCRDA